MTVHEDDESRGRLDLRVDDEWRARVKAVADRYGMTMSAYIRMAVTERLERDEGNPPPKRPKRAKD